jgi:hypothetical protein
MKPPNGVAAARKRPRGAPSPQPTSRDGGGQEVARALAFGVEAGHRTICVLLSTDPIDGGYGLTSLSSIMGKVLMMHPLIRSAREPPQVLEE